MGLDMYAIKTHPGDADEELFYWRKHPNLQGWMYDLHKNRGCTCTEGEFNGVRVRLNLEDINQLEKDVNDNNLPHTEGFFFSHSVPEDKVRDLEFIKLAREALAQGCGVYYDSWW